MRDGIADKAGMCFLGGLCLIAFSYARFIPDNSFLQSVFRELGVALAVASVVALSVDKFFQKHLVDETKRAAEEAGKTLGANVDQLGLNVSSLVKDTKSAAESAVAGLQQQVTKLGESVSQIGEESAGVLARVPTLSCCLKSGITNIFLSRSDAAAEARIMTLMSKAGQRIDIMGISLRSFFQGGGPMNRVVNNLVVASTAEDYAGPQWRVLVIDPEAEQARLRSMREELPGTAYGDGNLRREVNGTIEVVKSRYMKFSAKIQLHAYQGAPACFLLFVDNVMFIEQYHYGRERGQRAAELVPLVEFEEDSSTYRELMGHFGYMWDELSRDPYAVQGGRSERAAEPPATSG